MTPYGRAIGEILRSFEMCDRFLENLPVADTVIALQALAEQRNMTMDLKSPFLPANGYGDGRRAPGAMAS